MGRRWIANKLDEHWDERTEADGGPEGREYEVPKPQIDIEQELGQISLRSTDHINVVDGGDVNRDPLDAGYMHESKSYPTDVVVRVSRSPPDPPDSDWPGLVRFTGNGSHYGGIRGEIKRIMEIYRRGGDSGADTVQASSWSDQTGMTGINHYKGKWTVNFDIIAEEMLDIDG